MPAISKALEKIDPDEAWQPWKPTVGDPWCRKWAAHLYRRAGFGASREDLLEAERLGPEGTLEFRFRGRPDAAEVLETLVDIGRIAAASDDGGSQLRGWWLNAWSSGPNRPRAWSRSRQFCRNIAPASWTLTRLVAKWLCQKRVIFSRSGWPPWNMQ